MTVKRVASGGENRIFLLHFQTQNRPYHSSLARPEFRIRWIVASTAPTLEIAHIYTPPSLTSPSRPDRIPTHLLVCTDATARKPNPPSPRCAALVCPLVFLPHARLGPTLTPFLVGSGMTPLYFGKPPQKKLETMKKTFEEGFYKAEFNTSQAISQVVAGAGL